MDPDPDPLLLRKSGSAGNRTRDLCICSQKLWSLDQRGGRCGGNLTFFYFIVNKKKLKCARVQSLRRTAHTGSRGIALSFHDHGTRRGWGGQRHAPAALYPRERPGTHCTGGWVGPGPVWIGAENLAPTEIRSPDRPACKPAAIPTTLLRPLIANIEM